MGGQRQRAKLSPKGPDRPPDGIVVQHTVIEEGPLQGLELDGNVVKVVSWPASDLIGKCGDLIDTRRPTCPGDVIPHFLANDLKSRM